MKVLSNELHQNFTLMLDLGSRSKKLMGDIDKMADNYMSNANKSTMETIRYKFDAAKQFSDEKVNLAVQTYELVCNVDLLMLYYNCSTPSYVQCTLQVDERIRKLDSEIAQFEAEMKLKAEIRDTLFDATRNLHQKSILISCF